MKTVLIDPGHGGSDPGAVANGLKEKELNLDCSRILKSLLEQRGYKVFLTRQEDVYVPLFQRGEKAKGCAIACSIHHNAGNPSAKGAEVWFHDNSEAGRRLAILVEEELRKVCSSRGIKKDTERYRLGFYFLRKAEGYGVPAILIEVDFLTNPQSARVLGNRDEQIKRMQAVANGIDKFLKGGRCYA